MANVKKHHLIEHSKKRKKSIANIQDFFTQAGRENIQKSF